VTNIPIDQMAVRRNVVEGVRALLDTFGIGSDENQFVTGLSSGRLQEALQKIQEDPRPYSTYVMIAIASGAIRLAAHETGREETEMVDELARSFDVT
jgi:hypothetical protein